MDKRYISLNATLPKESGRYYVKLLTPDGVVESEADYLFVDDTNRDFDLDDFPEGSIVTAFCKIKD